MLYSVHPYLQESESIKSPDKVYCVSQEESVW